MRRLLLALGVFIAVLTASCASDDSLATEAAATAKPAATPDGNVVDVDRDDVIAEAVIVGTSGEQGITIYARPGLDQPVVGEIPPGASSVRFIGDAFETDDGIVWWLFSYDALQGWGQAQISYGAQPKDITSQVIAIIQAQTEYPSPSAVANAVGAALIFDLGANSIVEVATELDETESSAVVTLDLLGLQDDSVTGYRMLVTTLDTTGAGTSWRLGSVEQQLLCHRGVSPDGLCT